jgi:hypothetical protein
MRSALIGVSWAQAALIAKSREGNAVRRPADSFDDARQGQRSPVDDPLAKTISSAAAGSR